MLARSVVAAFAAAASLRPFKRNSQQRRENSRAGHKRPAQRSGNFRFSTSSAMMIHRHFKNAHSRPRRTHLHFKIPTVGLLAHAEPLKRISPNRAKRTHVCVTNPIKES